MDNIEEQKLKFSQKIDEEMSNQLVNLNNHIKLTSEDKSYILKVCRVTLERYFSGKETSVTDFSLIPTSLRERVDKIYITFYKKGKMIACYSSKDTSLPLIEQAIKATINAIKDKRKTKINKDDMPEIILDVVVMCESNRVAGGDFGTIKEHFDLGYQGITIQNGRNKATFKNSVAVTKNYNITKTLARITKKAKLPKSSYKNTETQLTFYDALQFSETKKGLSLSHGFENIVRNSYIVLLKDISRQSLEHSLYLAAEYFKNNFRQDGRIVYINDPITKKNQISYKKAASIRGAAATWMFALVANYFQDPIYHTLARNSVNYFIENFYEEDDENDTGFLNILGDVNIGHAAFILLAILGLEKNLVYKPIARKIANFILSMEENGFLYPVLYPDKMGQLARKELYYPGEALTALMAYYESEGHEESLQCALRVMDYYQDLFRRHEKRINMAAWMSKAYAKVYKATKDRKHADFVLEINDYVCSRQIVDTSKHIDKIGSFSSKGNVCGAAVFTESMIEGYTVARLVGDSKRQENYLQHILMGLRFIKQNQYDERYQSLRTTPCFGGFRTSAFEQEVRIDNVQHAACAMLKTLEEVLLKY